MDACAGGAKGKVGKLALHNPGRASHHVLHSWGPGGKKKKNKTVSFRSVLDEALNKLMKALPLSTLKIFSVTMKEVYLKQYNCVSE